MLVAACTFTDLIDLDLTKIVTMLYIGISTTLSYVQVHIQFYGVPTISLSIYICVYFTLKSGIKMCAHEVLFACNLHVLITKYFRLSDIYIYICGIFCVLYLTTTQKEYNAQSHTTKHCARPHKKTLRMATQDDITHGHTRKHCAGPTRRHGARPHKKTLCTASQEDMAHGYTRRHCIQPHKKTLCTAIQEDIEHGHTRRHCAWTHKPP